MNTETSTTQLNTASNQPILLGDRQCLEMIFPDISRRPGIRTWREWRAKGFYSYHKIGKSVYLDPVAVRKALDKRFIIEATQID